MVSETLLHLSPATPGARFLGSPLHARDSPARCGRVQASHVILGRVLGTGGFGSVYAASIRGRTVAVKTYHKRCGNPRAVRQSYRSELTAYRLGLKHENVVSILGATSLHDFEDGAWVVMDLAGQRNLQSVLDDPVIDLDHSLRLNWTLQMARGLQYLHSVGVVHLDLKPANCLLSHDLRLRIADFGCCLHLDDPRHDAVDDAMERSGAEKEREGPMEGTGPKDGQGVASSKGAWLGEVAGTVAYRAPELLRGRKPSPSADIYSLGITLWQMRTCRGPYEGVPVHAVVYQVVSHDLRPRRPSEDGDSPFEVLFGDLYTQCWAREQRDRPQPQDVVQAVRLWMENL